MSGLGGYQMRRQIGSGSSGTVWEALRPGPIPQVVAVKRLRGEGSPDELAQLRREAMVLTELDHPHIVRVLEVIDDGDGVAIAMQFAPGGSFEAMLAERGRLTPGEVVAVAVPIAEALSSAHRRGILHVDVKPANILFTSDGEPLLGDFGVARTLGRLTAVLGSQGPLAGTAHYLAPELLDGSTPDPRSDVYSLAVVCYEALTGKRPFDAALPLAVLRAADSGGHDSLTARSDVPAPLARVIEQAMARDPDLRVASAGRLAWELRAALPQAQIRLPGTAAIPTDEHGPGDGTTPTPTPTPTPPQAGAITEPLHTPAEIPTPAGSPTVGRGDDAARDTRTFGPRPPVPEPPAVGRSRVTTIVVVAALVVVVAGALGYLVLGSSSPGDDCPTAERPTVDPGSQVVAGDPEGDGCVTYGVYELDPRPDDREDMFLTIEVGGQQRSLRLGALGDRLFLGDWDCDGTDTPGLYRWGRGEVVYFDVWPDSDRPPYRAAETESVPRQGRASVVLPEENDRGGDGDCEQIEVRAPAAES
ncbi:MAG: serine/threonine-protein kinase [Acidimicrobiales bacterium]